MSSTNESGHVKNLANLRTLIDHCTQFGRYYAPTNPRFTLQHLNMVYASAEAALNNHLTAKVNYDNIVNDRKLVYARLKPLANRVLNALAVSGASAETINDARGYYNKIMGRRAQPKARAKKKNGNATDSAPGRPLEASRYISVSQQSHDKLVEHFAQLVGLLTAERKYTPNEEELKVASLGALLKQMREMNSAVITGFGTLSSARIVRDQAFEMPTTGLIDICQDVKTYVKSVFGTGSPQFRLLGGLKFRRHNH